jgi:hypothetical protein
MASVTIEPLRIGFKVPRRFEETRWAVAVGSPVGTTYRAGDFKRFTIEVTPVAGLAAYPNKADPAEGLQWLQRVQRYG